MFKYLLRIFRGLSLKRIAKCVNEVKKKSGRKSRNLILLDMIGCGIKYGAGFHDYLIFEYYNMKRKERKTYMTRVKNKRLHQLLNDPSKTNILYELQLLFSSLKLYENSYYDPRSFVVANNLNFAEQMDADEFYGTLIDKIEKDIKDIYYLKDNTKNEKNKIVNYKYKDLFNYFFGIKVLDELQFVDCGHKRYNEFCYYNIQIEIKNCNNLYESLNNYFKAEVMDGENKINCEECNTKRICHKHLLLKSLPNILVICLKRFEFDYETMLKFKLNKYLEFPFHLNMKKNVQNMI